MTNYTVHTQETAPDNSKPILAGAEKAFGFVPNLMAIMAETPVAVDAYASLMSIFDKTTIFTPTEQQIILMTNNRLNGCTYCMAAHSTISQMQGVAADVIEALRGGTDISDPKLESLRVFAAKVNEQRGVLSPEDIEAFLSAGYTKAHILEVVVGTAMKVLSNYTNHIANTPVDEAFQANTWSADQSKAA